MDKMSVFSLSVQHFCWRTARHTNIKKDRAIAAFVNDMVLKDLVV